MVLIVITIILLAICIKVFFLVLQCHDLMRIHINDWLNWSIKDFKKLPYYNGNKRLELTSLIIIPTQHLHDSGFSCMEFIALVNEVPTYRLSGTSDVIHLDGIGAYGINRSRELKMPIDWTIDCLPCGLLRLFILGRRKIVVDTLQFSSFEIFAT